jgi:hypothetical protein
MGKGNAQERRTIRHGSPSETFESTPLGDGDGSLRSEITAQRDISAAEWASLEAPTRGAMSADAPRSGPEPDPPGGRKPAGRPAPSPKSGWLGR